MSVTATITQVKDEMTFEHFDDIYLPATSTPNTSQISYSDQYYTTTSQYQSQGFEPTTYELQMPPTSAPGDTQMLMGMEGAYDNSAANNNNNNSNMVDFHIEQHGNVMDHTSHEYSSPGKNYTLNKSVKCNLLSRHY